MHNIKANKTPTISVHATLHCASVTCVCNKIGGTGNDAYYNMYGSSRN